MNKLRFGILSTAKIAKKNWKAIHQSGNSILTAVASRNIERSRQFILDCQTETPFEVPPTALGSYEELLASKNIDAVYIPLPTALRKEWVIRAAKADKHVICEKPCAINTADLLEMISECKKNHVQFMDGVMFMHNNRLGLIRKTLNDQVSIGAIKRITSYFSFLCPEKNIRTNHALEPFGCLGDLGWYCIRFALWTMNWEMPHSVNGKMISQAENDFPGVPLEFSCELFFDNGVSSGFYCSFLEVFRQWADINGSKGYLRIPDFVIPMIENENCIEINGHKTIPNHSANFLPITQEANMIRNYANQVFSGQLNEAWPEMALRTQQVLDTCMASSSLTNVAEKIATM